MLVNLATTRSFLDVQPQKKLKRGEASTFGEQTRDEAPWGTLGTIFNAAGKGKKVTNEIGSRKAPNSTSSKKAPSACPFLTLQGHGTNADVSSSSTEDGGDGSQRKWRFLQQRRSHLCEDCGGRKGCVSNALAAQVRFDIKSKDPPVFTGKPFDDVEAWV